MDTTRMGGASFSSDETRLLVSSDATGVFNVYSIDIATGERTALTASTDDATYAVSYFPGDDRVLFTRDRGGDENSHLFVRERDGTERDLTPGERVKAMFAGWRRDEQAFFVLTNERDPRFFDLYEHDVATYARQRLYQDDEGWQFGGISDDLQWLVFEKPRTTTDSDLYLVHRPTGEKQHITPHEGPATHSPATFDLESRWLYYLTNEGDEFNRVRRYELSSGRHEEVERANWDVEFMGFSHHGKWRVTGINEDARTTVRIVEAKTGRAVKLPRLPEGEIRGLVIARSEQRLAFYLNGDRSPSDLWVVDLETRDARRLSNNLSRAIDPEDLVDARVERFASFDGMTIPGILYRPHQASATTPAPAIVLVHGGPGGQARRGYNSLAQYLANHGYLVFDINNRGSSGYGKTFFMADDRKHGREPLWDCVEARRWLARRADVDGERMAIMGGSYGGYMVLCALAFQPGEFQVGVNIFGVSNWLRTLESIPPYWESFREALYQEIGHPVEDREMLMATSPLLHAGNIREPLLVIQGANDPRVIQAESDDIVAAVRRNDVPVEYVVFPDEGHGFSKKSNQLTAYRSIKAFLDQHLGK